MHSNRKDTVRPQQARPGSILIASVLLSVFNLCVAAAFAPAHPRPAALLMAAGASSLLLTLLNEHRKGFSALALRTAADLVLLTPLLLIPFARIFR